MRGMLVKYNSLPSLGLVERKSVVITIAFVTILYTRREGMIAYE